jgi:peptidoglycan/xylan/chitin deacetylase (PgdA/CDA1 family)
MAQVPQSLPKPDTAEQLLHPPRDLDRGSPVYQRARDWSRRFAALAGDPLARLCGPRPDQAFGVLMYHRVTELTSGTPAPSYNVRPGRFRAQLAGLLRAGYTAWPLRRVLECHEEQRPIPRKTFVVTFDDGYANVHHYALPILQELQIPATIFLATAYLDSRHPFPADNWSVAGKDVVPPLSWMPLSTQQCRELQASGLIELGAHTHTHQDFRHRAAELYLDMVECLEVLRDRFGVSDSTFAFPYGTRELGFCSPEMTAAVQAAGARCAFSTDDGLVFPDQDRYGWGRMEVDDYDTGASLAARLSGWTRIFQQFTARAARILRGKSARGLAR